MGGPGGDKPPDRPSLRDRPLARPRPLHRSQLPLHSSGSLAVVHYDLRLNLDIAGEALSGELVVTARAHGAGSDLVVLDVGDLTIDSASVGERRLEASVADHRLTLRLPIGSRTADASV